VTSFLLYPDTRVFKVALWEYLKKSTVLTPIVNLSQDHPKTANDIQNGKSRIVLSPAGNPGVGQYLTRNISSPTIRFTAYAVREASCDNAIHQLINVLESWLPADFQMEEQSLQFICVEQRIESLFNDAINLYFASVLYKFHLTR
jgi:hypothetical protein